MFGLRQCVCAAYVLCGIVFHYTTSWLICLERRYDEIFFCPLICSSHRYTQSWRIFKYSSCRVCRFQHGNVTTLPNTLHMVQPTHLFFNMWISTPHRSKQILIIVPVAMDSRDLGGHKQDSRLELTSRTYLLWGTELLQPSPSHASRCRLHPVSKSHLHIWSPC